MTESLAIPTRPLKVAIIGFCDSSRNMAPYDDPTWEFWGLNRGYIFQKRIDRFFEMHSPEIYSWPERRPGNHMQWLKTYPGPIYMHLPNPDIPTCVVYPLKEIADFLGPMLQRVDKAGLFTDMAGEPYLSASIAYEIALAIYEGAEEIALYGIDLSTEAEYAWQKPCVEWLLGVAAGRGIKVTLPDNCPLLRATLYGRGHLKPEGEHVTQAQWEHRLQGLVKSRNKAFEELQQLLGARRELQFLGEQIMPGLDAERLDERRRQMDAAIEKVGGSLNQMNGSIKETMYWMHQTPDGQSGKQAIEQLVEQMEIDGAVPAPTINGHSTPSEGDWPSPLDALGVPELAAVN